MPVSLLRRIAVIALALPVAAQEAPAPEPPLLPGPYPVGFRSTWVLDEGRVYRTAWDDGATYGAEEAPRPVLALLWFPARASEAPVAEVAHLPHSAYLDVPADDARLAKLAAALSEHARGIVAELVLGASVAELDDAGRAALAEVLAEPTPCLAGAEPADGPFPLVLHHSGAGSSFEDDAAFCAFLASHGYAVVASPFYEADGSDLGIDGGRGSAEDAQTLVRWASGLGFVDAHRVGLLGHSAGAQAFLRFAAEPGCVADALVLLDTTVDYYDPGMPLHAALRREAREGVAHLTRPMLVVASPEAFFALCDELVHAERTYVTVPDLGHDEFIAQGHQRLARIERDAARGSAADAEELARLPAARASWRALSAVVKAFLDAELRGDRTELDALVARDAARPWTHAELRAVRVARDASGPAPWDPASAAPPSPRQFVRLVLDAGAEAGCAALALAVEKEPEGPLATSTMLAGSLLHRLVAEGRTEEARRYLAAVREIPLDPLGVFEFLADINQMQHELDAARALLDTALTLDPDRPGLAEKRRQLDGG